MKTLRPRDIRIKNIKITDEWHAGVMIDSAALWNVYHTPCYERETDYRGIAIEGKCGACAKNTPDEVRFFIEMLEL